MEMKQLSMMKTPQILWKKQIQIMKMEKYVSTITSNFCKSVIGTQMFSGDKDGNVGEGDKVLADGAELTYASDASLLFDE